MTKAAVKEFKVQEEPKKIDLPPHYVNKEDRVLDPTLIDKSALERMPNPTGWRLLILPYRGKGKTEGGIYLPDKVQEDSNIATVAGYVLKVGPLAYRDEEKFPNGAWCEKGNWVIFARYAGSRFRIEGGEVRVLNDDEILATILDPEDILHF
jgi:co-chaperonin GroES (HSP10)|tara:strand:- start:2400 stop:2855 length:456 start_codon:yes stop_codon:yes gene_type:complete